MILAGTVFSRASVIYKEDFNYATGTLTGDGKWTTLGTAAQVQSPTLEPYTSGVLYVPQSGNQVLTPSDGSRSELNLSSTLGASGSTVYISFLAQSSNASSAYSGLSLHTGASYSSDSIFIGQDYGSHVWGIDISTNGVETNALTSISCGSEALLVVGITFNGSSSTLNLYVNPTSTTLPSTPSASLTFTESSSLYNYIWLQSVNSTLQVDGIQIGTSYADVVSVPEPSTDSILILGAFALVCRLTCKRRISVVS